MDYIAQIRSFNRTYTHLLGLLDKHILDSPFSLTESRILYEIAHHENLSAKFLTHTLNINKGYVSRTLKKLQTQGLIEQKTSAHDKRSNNISLTEKGKRIFHTLDHASSAQISAMFSGLNPYEEKRIIAALGEAQQILEKGRSKVSLEDIQIRNHLIPGDIGFIIQSHGELYEKEYHFSNLFEKYVTESLLEFINLPKPNRNKVWLCEHNHNRMGFISLMDRGEAAQLRYFFIYPEYRGVGLGGKLMRLFMQELKKHDFNSCYLWTTNELDAATFLYRKHGFKLEEEVPSSGFGKELKEVKYVLEL